MVQLMARICSSPFLLFDIVTKETQNVWHNNETHPMR